MLSRAARNAYSWWWASHIRTKQSNWLDQNIQDMEEKVEYILKIITEDGDSFRVRAEQYYRKRPELVNFVEDTFRGYRALAERYDHLSKDLQSANRTIAMIFPERVQMSIDEDEYEDFTSNFDEHENMIITNSHVPLPPKQNNFPKMESVVEAMVKKRSKMPTKMMSKKGLVKIGVDETGSKVSKSFGLSKDEAVVEIDKLQKEILGFQTEKEFVKSSYESAISKYWEIENKINEMHTKISNLQHEFAAGGQAMDDQDAQTLMSSSALKMCKQTLDKLKCKQTRFKSEAVVEHHRVDDIRNKFEALIARNNTNEHLSNLEQSIEHDKDKKECENIEEKVDDQDHQVTISEVAEKIEQLVDKVITLETDLASQTALVIRLRFEIDELHEKLQSLELENNNKNIKIKKLEEELERVEKLDKQVKVQNAQLQTSFDKADVSLDNLSKDLLVAKQDDMIFQPELVKNQNISEVEEKEKESDDFEGFVNKSNEKLDEEKHVTESLQVASKDEDVTKVEEDEPNWRLIFSNGIEDREKMLLEEYTSTLKSFKEVKQKLKETEMRNRARSFKSAVQMKMLKKANDSKDAEIRSLYEKLKLLVDGGTQTSKERDETTADIEVTTASSAIDEIKKARELVDGGTQTSKEVDETTADIEVTTASNAIDEMKKARELVDGGTQTSKELDETTDNIELTKAANSVDDVIGYELEESTPAATTKKWSITDGAEVLEIEEEIREEIEDLRKENMELWLRFSTSYHQINRFQDSFHDLTQEIKQVHDKNHELGSGKQRRHHHRHHSSIAFDVRPLYRQLRDMQTEVVLWLEKSGILEDDLQHRLISLSDIQNELSNLTNNVSQSETTNVQLNNYQAAKFQGEVLNMKQENVKVIKELREASERVTLLQVEIEKTLSKLDEELGQKNKSNTSSRIPFRSLLFGTKLRKKHKHSLFTCMSPSLQRQYSNLKELPQPREDS